MRRENTLRAKGIHFFGLGISGGEFGARHGPAMMAGGNRAVYARAQNMLEAIAAHFDGEPCCALVGENGAGHFVKMVHNGIEYAIMQIISEAYMIMREQMGLDASRMAQIFSGLE